MRGMGSRMRIVQPPVVHHMLNDDLAYVNERSRHLIEELEGGINFMEYLEEFEGLWECFLEQVASMIIFGGVAAVLKTYIYSVYVKIIGQRARKHKTQIGSSCFFNIDAASGAFDQHFSYCSSI